MKKITLFLTVFLFAFTMLQAQDNYFRQFNGTNQSIYVKDNANGDLDISNDWTIEAWVKVHSYTDGTWSTIVDRRGVFSLYLIDDANADFAVKFVARDVSDNIIASLQSDASSTNLSLDQWFHVAVKYDGSDARLYLNGNLIVEDNADTDFNLSQSSNYLNIGARWWGAYSRHLDGSVDQVRISNTARYTGNFTPPSFYSLLATDANTALLLNFENNKADDANNFASGDIVNHGSDVYVRKVDVTPSATQNINTNTDGDMLTVAEEGTPTSREWKYATTSGGTYSSFGTPQTGTTYTPNFSSAGSYYVVCQSDFGGEVLTSNEVVILAGSISNSIAPIATQYLLTNQGGTQLTVTESHAADSREWKFSTTSGGAYSSFGTPETGTTYTPNFSTDATYYVVCQSLINGNTVTSNEVQIVVSAVTNTNSIAPVDVQHLVVNTNGTTLSVTENPAADSREWKYSTTSGSGYNSFMTPETALTYTPAFNAQGTYYVVCESNFGGTIVTSNEVKIVVDTDASDYYLAFDGGDSFYVKDVGESYINVTDNWTIETWVKVDSHTNGTFPVIIDRQECFSMYVQSDGAGTDDYSIAFVTRDASDAIVHSLSSANIGTVTFNFSEWYHVAVQYDGTTAKMFINGNEVASSTDDFTLRDAGQYINIASRYRSGYERYLTGSLENVHFSKIARHAANFTPDFYAKENADANSIFCLNLENNALTDLYDASGNFTNIALRTSPNTATWKLKVENTITPNTTQNIVQNADGDELTVDENGLASSREWKYSTTSGGAYSSFSTPVTTKIYTPNFSAIGTYYVVCESIFNGTMARSNEVQINVSETATITTGAITGSPFSVSSTEGASVDVPYTITGTYDIANVFKAYLSDATGDFTSETEIGSLTSTTAGTITATIPAGTIAGNGYRIRVEASNPRVDGSDNGQDLEVIQLGVSIAPVENQHLVASTNGTVLTATETGTSDSREWKYSTTSGSGYTSFTTPETGTTYTPNFDTKGIYYVICESTFGTSVEISNEVKIVVEQTASDYYLSFDGNDAFYSKDENLEFYNTVTNNYTIETWVKIADYTAGTYPVIMDRDSTFSLYVQADDTDDFSIAFVTRDANDGVAFALSSANLPSVAFNFNEWYHVAVQYDGTTAKMFINGTEIASSTDDFTLLENQTKYVNFGARYRNGYERYLTGSLENIHFSKLARYSADFTPNFYTQQQADVNSIFCLNLENNGSTNLFDASGNFEVHLLSGGHDASWKLKAENSVVPGDIQNIELGTDGTELTVVENGIATSREWKFTTTQGTGYTSFGTPVTTLNYTPNFATAGTYYVVCESVFNGTMARSNEVIINVSDVTPPTYDVSFEVKNGANAQAIENASVTFGTYGTKYTDASGYVVFNNVAETSGTNAISYTVSATGFSNETGDIQVLGNTNQVVNMQPNVSVNNISKSEINIYPNPATDVLYFSNLKSNTKILIYDNLGRLVSEKVLTNNSINVSNLPNGFYTILIKNDNFVKSSKFVKK